MERVETAWAWMDDLPSPLLAIAPDGRVLAASPPARLLLGAGAVPGREVHALFDGEAAHEAVREALAECLSSPGRTVQREGPVRAYGPVRRMRFTLRASRGAVLAACEDVGGQVRAERELAHFRALAQATLEATADGIMVVDQGGRVFCYNQRLLTLWRVPPAVAAAGTERALMSHVAAQLADAGAFAARAAEIAADPAGESHDLLECADGRVFERYSQPLRVGGVPAGRVWSFSDVTESRLAEQALKATEERWEHASRGSSEGLWNWDLQSGELYLSPRWRALMGAAELEPTLAAWAQRIHPDDRAAFLDALDEHLRGDSASLEVEYRALFPDAAERWMLCRGVAVRGADGRVQCMAGSQTDVTDRRAAERQLERGIQHDALTGLASRALFADRVRAAAARADRFSVLLLDLDRFRAVNESLSHAGGDELLRAVARRLEKCVRPDDLAARLGDDEFALLLRGVGDEAAARRIAGRVAAALQPPVRVQGREVFTSACMGIVLHGGGSADELLRDAETALNHARTQGPAQQQVFAPEMHARAIARLTVETELRLALERQELRVHYQPLVDLRTGRVGGFEALARWPLADGTLRPPLEFIPVAEQTGLIVPLGMQVLRMACRQAAEWAAASAEGQAPYVNVNLSPVQLLDPGLVDGVAAVLAETGLAPASLRVEITEGVLAEAGPASEALHALKRLGIGVCIDDFGTGYSSLSYLHRFPADCLKVDRSFVNALAAGPGAAEIVRTILSLARILGLDTVAEGVETPEQIAFLRAEGCDYAQGFGLHRPLPPEAATALLGTAADPALTAV